MVGLSAMLRRSVSADAATGTVKLQDLPAHYLYTVLGKDGLRGVIFETEERELADKRNAMLWEHATAGVTRVLQRE